MAEEDNNFNFLDCVDPPKENVEEETKPKKKTTKKSKSKKTIEDSEQLQESSIEVIEHENKPANIEIDDKIKKEGEDKQTLIMTILRYQDSKRFSDYLKKHALITKPEALDKKEIKQLKELLVRIRFCLSNRGASSLIDDFIKAGLSGAEALISTKTKYKITGMTEICFNDEEWLDCYELCKLEYLSFGYIRPELRLLLATLRIGSTCHVINTNERFKNVVNQPQSERAADNFGANNKPILDEPNFD